MPPTKSTRSDAIALATGVAAKASLDALEAPSPAEKTASATATADDKAEKEKSKEDGPKDPRDGRLSREEREERRARRPLGELSFDRDDDYPSIHGRVSPRRHSGMVHQMPGSGVFNDDNGEDDPDVKKILDGIPADERAKVIFRFRVKKPGKGGGGRVNNPVGEFHAVGDDWQQRTRDEIASTKGPGTYEGLPLTADGKPTKGDPWVFEVTEEQARAAGWRTESETKSEASVATAAPVQTPVRVNEVSEAEKEKEHTEYLRHKLESTKLEIQLQTLMSGAKPSSDDDQKKTETGMSDEVARQLRESDRARLKAEHDAELAKIKADNDAKLASAKIEAEREGAKFKAEAAEAARKSEDGLRELQRDLQRKETEHTTKLSELQRSLEASSKEREDKLSGQFEAKFAGLEKALEKDRAAEKDREKEREKTEREREKEREKTERDKESRQPERRPEDTAAAVAGALAPLFQMLSPFGGAILAKLNQPAPTPPPAPDPMKQMESMAKVFAPMFDRLSTPPPPPPAPPPPPPPVDTMALVQQTVGLMQSVIPKQQAGPRPDEMAATIANAVAQTLDKRFPQQPQQAQQPAQDPMEFTTRVLGFAKQFSDMNRPQETERESHAAEDPLESAERTIGRLRNLGVDIRIGNQPIAAPEAPPQASTVQEVFSGIKDTLPAFGEALGKFVQSRGPQLDPKLVAEVQKEALRRKTLMKKKGQVQTQAQRQRPMPQPQAQSQPQAQPAAVQRARPIQPPQARQIQPPQARPIQPQAPRQAAPQQAAPQAPAPQAPAPQAPAHVQQAPAPQAPQAAPAKNKFLERQEQPYGLPTVYMPPARKIEPAPFPTDTVPQRVAPARQPFVPMEALPTVVAQPQQQVPQRQPTQGLAPQMPPQAPPQVQQAPPMPQAPAQPVQDGMSEQLSQDGNPTQKSWGELAGYLCGAINRLDDPDVAALALLERFPKSTAMVQTIGSTGGVDGLDVSLTTLAGSAGPYAGVVGELASKIRSEPGKGWATRLIATLSGSTHPTT